MFAAYWEKRNQSNSRRITQFFNYFSASFGKTQLTFYNIQVLKWPAFAGNCIIFHFQRKKTLTYVHGFPALIFYDRGLRTVFEAPQYISTNTRHQIYWLTEFCLSRTKPFSINGALVQLKVKSFGHFGQHEYHKDNEMLHWFPRVNWNLLRFYNKNCAKTQQSVGTFTCNKNLTLAQRKNLGDFFYCQYRRQRWRALLLCSNGALTDVQLLIAMSP